MKAIFAFLLAFAWSVNAAISTATKPHTIDSAATPKVSYVDDNDEALLDKINEVIDTVNLHNSSGAVVGDLFSSTGDMRLLIDSDNNGTNRWMVTANGATDTLWRILESGAWRGFGDGYVAGKVVASDSLVGATVRATGNLSAGGTLAVTGASTIAALSATTGTFSGALSTTAHIDFDGFGTSGTSRIFRTVANGLQIRGNTGSSYDFGIESAGGSNILLNPTGTTGILFPGSAGVTVTNSLTLSSLSSGRIPVVSTSGLITQDNLYWDATNDRLGIGNSASSPAVDVDVVSSFVGGSTTIRVSNPDNTNTVSHARLVLTSGGASGGDAFAQYTVSGVTNWAAGVDNSDADAFVITPSSTPGGATNGLRISTAGAVGVPSLTASLPVFTDASKNLVSNTMTGTGSVVMSTSPTLVTPTLGVASATSMALGGGEAFVYGDTSFTMTATGMTTSPTGTAYASRVGNVVTMYVPGISGTSNSTQFTLTGIPTGWRPTRQQYCIMGQVQDNSVVEYSSYAYINTSGVIDMGRSNGSAWTNSGTKANNIVTITYNLQ